MQQSYAEGARLRAAEEAERHRLQLELAEVRPEAEGVEEGRTASPNPERHPQPCV